MNISREGADIILCGGPSALITTWTGRPDWAFLSGLLLSSEQVVNLDTMTRLNYTEIRDQNGNLSSF
jgi:hypothetical protein